MERQFPIIFVQLSIILTLTGCASLRSAEPDEDPIAAAAARYRDPAPIQEAETERRPASLPESITLGMSMNDVRSIWGEPGDIESAGDPRDGNQRWTYFSGLSGRMGLSSKRLVYFEGGRVAGWKNRN